MGAVHLSVTDGVARLSFDNPAKLNAIDVAMWRALPGLLAQVAEDQAIRVLVLAGDGERAFCTGNDISEFDTLRANPEQAAAYNALQRRVAEAMVALPKPAIAAIHGHALGAGMELALQCDFRYATPAARMGVPAARLGLPYRLEDIVKLVDVMGLAKAREAVLTGRHYAGEELLAMGLVQRILPDRAALDAVVDALAQELATNAPLSMAAAKLSFRALGTAAPDDAARRAADDACYASADYAEGRRARAEKRPPNFTGS